MTSETKVWAQLSQSIGSVVAAVQGSIVAVHGGRSTTSGVVWRPGIVVTVQHGMRRREGLMVIHEGQQLKAALIGSDPGTDVAVLRVEGSDLPPTQVAAADAGRVGEVVLAVGRSRLGDVSASMGIVARTGSAFRTWRGGQIDRLIRPDVRLYVGQQGSALVNEQGQVLGINSSSLARAAVITVPSETVNRVLDAIAEHGRVPRPYIGVAMQAVPLPQSARTHFGEETKQALLVMYVEPEGAAAQGGLLVGDLLLSLDGQAVESMREFQRRVQTLRVGHPLQIKVMRGGTALDLNVNVGDRA